MAFRLTHPRARTAPRLALAGVALLALVSPASAQNYPHVALHCRVYGSGYPLWDSAGSYDTQVLDEISRYHEVTLQASPITEYRPDALLQLRQRHPGIELLAYVHGHTIWNNVRPDSFVNIPSRIWRTVRDMDGFLYNKNGDQYGLTISAFANVNIAKRDGNGTYVVAEALAQLFHDAIVSKGIWDGLYIDTYCNRIAWSQTPAEQIDYVRAGYPSIQTFDDGWAAGTDTLASRLRQLSGPSVILVGNCIPGTKYVWFNGWQAENFPFQNGGTWDENMFRDPGGYFAGEKGYRAPRYNHLFTAASDPSRPYSADNMRRVRLGLGSVALGGGFHVFAYAGLENLVYPYHHWWYDEYAVDRATGRASTLLRDVGWLGQPLGSYNKVIWVSSQPDVVTNPGFETDLSGWTFVHIQPATFTRVVGGAAVGAASAKVSLSQPESVPWACNISTTTSLGMTYGQYYSATFSAKASTPRKITVVAAPPAGGEVAHGYADLTTSWQRFQIVFYPTASAGAKLQFHVGASAGDVWFDDVHFQAGISSVYRRDFQHGIVLVNPTRLDLLVPIGPGFAKIRGLADPSINDGTVASQYLVRSNDALFLMGADQVKPASVLDLRFRP